MSVVVSRWAWFKLAEVSFFVRLYVFTISVVLGRWDFSGGIHPMLFWSARSRLPLGQIWRGRFASGGGQLPVIKQRLIETIGRHRRMVYWRRLAFNTGCMRPSSSSLFLLSGSTGEESFLEVKAFFCTESLPAWTEPEVDSPLDIHGANMSCICIIWSPSWDCVLVPRCTEAFGARIFSDALVFSNCRF